MTDPSDIERGDERYLAWREHTDNIILRPVNIVLKRLAHGLYVLSGIGIAAVVGAAFKAEISVELLAAGLFACLFAAAVGLISELSSTK